MDLKNILKNLKLNENNISMLLGAAVIVVVGFLVVNYFRNLETGTTIPSTSTTSEENQKVKLPTTHEVTEGETLWSIAEKYYGSGYNWVDIQKENNLSNAAVITKGQTLSIPDVEAKAATSTSSATAMSTESAKPTEVAQDSPTPTISATPVETPEATMEATTKGGLSTNDSKMTNTSTETSITGDNYTVVHGDNLWTIAVRAYGDGYQWTKIAKANHLAHPGVIHAGNILQLPR